MPDLLPPDAAASPVLDFRNNALQERFVFCPDKRVAFAGAIRSGKTIGSLARALFHAQIYPGSRILIGRKFFTDLESTTLKELFRIISAQNGGGYRNPGPLVIRHDGGSGQHTFWIRTKGDASEITCRPCAEISKQLGLEISEYLIDQVEELDEEVFQHIRSRMSYWNSERIAKFQARYGYAPRSWETVTCNPDPGWVKSFLFEQEDTQSQYYLRPEDRWTLFQTDIEQNRLNLGPDYIDDLYRRMPKDWCDRFLRGDWSIRGGAVYKEFNEAVHCIQEFPVPGHWVRFLAHDWGISDRHRCVFLWGAMDERGTLYVTDELSVTNKLVSEVAEMVHRKTGQDKHWMLESDGGVLCVMDPATNQRNGTNGRNVKSEFAQYRVYGRNANNDVDAGINKVAERLHVNSATKRAGLYIFKNRCPFLTRGLKLYQWMPPNSNGISPGRPVKKDDDEVDCLRYLVMDALETVAPAASKDPKAGNAFEDYIMKTYMHGGGI